MKKMLTILVTAALLVSLCACSGGQASSAEPAASGKEETAEAEAPEEEAQDQEEASQQAETQETAPAEQEPAEPEVKSFKAEGYTIYYEVVPEDRVNEVIGDLVEYIDTDGIDMEQNKLFYIHYTGAEQDGKEVPLSTIWRTISWGKNTFTVNGIDYKQPAILMSSGTQTYITYLFVPADTPEDADVSIKY